MDTPEAQAQGVPELDTVASEVTMTVLVPCSKWVVVVAMGCWLPCILEQHQRGV